MKKSRFTESQIIGILKEAESGIPVAELCRTHGALAHHEHRTCPHIGCSLFILSIHHPSMMNVFFAWIPPFNLSL